MMRIVAVALMLAGVAVLSRARRPPPLPPPAGVHAQIVAAALRRRRRRGEDGSRRPGAPTTRSPCNMPTSHGPECASPGRRSATSTRENT